VVQRLGGFAEVLVRDPSIPQHSLRTLTLP
jgi:hypothetical protein